MSWNSMSGAGDSDATATSTHPRIIIFRIDTEAVTDDIIEPAFSEIEFDMPGFLLRAFPVEPATGEKCGGDRVVARAAWRRAQSRRGYGFGRRRRARAHFG